ncbi:hypothetical protein P308_11650 [Pseudomonas piscis]|nr:hypothetical protein P308_11650 [Pseudomonas piscis]
MLSLDSSRPVAPMRDMNLPLSPCRASFLSVPICTSTTLNLQY